MINSPGYKEKTNEKIQQANADKLQSLDGEIMSLERDGNNLLGD